MSRQGQPKNRAPAPIQISAEHLIREATDLKLDFVPPQPKTYVVDEDEVNIEKLEKRKGFENVVRTNPGHMGEWSKYALWEESMGDFERARSVFERALGVNHKVHSMWVKYAEMEAKNRFINRARNVWDRAVTILPRIDMLWYKYAWMEEQLEQLPAARAVFERWMKWEPKESGWMTYVNFEVRYDEWKRAREIMSRYVECHKYEKTFIKWANWEMYKAKDAASARQVYSRGIAELPEDELSEEIFLKFSKFEEKVNESERARVILTFALTKFEKNPKIEQAIVSLEKRHGTVESIEEAVLSKRRHQYEQQLIQNGGNEYDTWFDYIKLEENHAIDRLRELIRIRKNNGEEIDSKNDAARDDILSSTRDTYERAISNVPPVMEKKYWKRYIYLWIKYALFEELVANNIVRTRAVYLEMLKLIPHEDFTFAKVWIMYSKFEIRQNQLTVARKSLGRSLGLCPKHKLFRSYIELERSMGNVDRCRKLYSKYLEWCPSDQDVWVQYARLEGDVGEEERCRAVYDVALSLGDDDEEESDGSIVLDRPEVVWKSYIDYEITSGEVTRARALYERLLQETTHVKVWLSFVRFEEDVRTGKIETKDSDSSSSSSINRESPAIVRGIFDRGYAAVKADGEGESRALMLSEWLKYEKNLGVHASAEEIHDLEGRQPKMIKRKRRLEEGSNNEEFEEYYDYVFPEDEKKDTANLKILQIAQKWKAKQEAAKQAEGKAATAAAIAKVANAVSVNKRNIEDENENEKVKDGEPTKKKQKL
jgi:crooked neck